MGGGIVAYPAGGTCDTPDRLTPFNWGPGNGGVYADGNCPSTGSDFTCV